MPNNNKKFGSFEIEGNKQRIGLKGFRVERSYDPGTPKIIQWVIKYSGGLVKDEKQATYVLLGFILFTISVSFYLFFGWEKTVKVKYTPVPIIEKEFPDVNWPPLQ